MGASSAIPEPLPATPATSSRGARHVAATAAAFVEQRLFAGAPCSRTPSAKRAAWAEQWFSRDLDVVRTSFSGDEEDPEYLAAFGGFKTCMMALMASSAAFLSSYVTYNIEKEHHEHEEAELRAERGPSPREREREF